MLPKMTSSSSGKPTPQTSPTRSRTNSFASVAVSRTSADREAVARGAAVPVTVVTDMERFSFAELAELVAVMGGEGDKRVLQAGLLDPQLPGDDPLAGEQRDDRAEHVAAAGDLELVAVPQQAGDLGQREQRRLVYLGRRTEPDHLVLARAGGQVGRAAGGDHAAGVDDRDPVAQPLGFLHEVGDQDHGDPPVPDPGDQRP